MNRNPFTLLTFLLACFWPVLANGAELNLPATGVWNGFNNHLNIIECSNIAGEDGEVLVSVYDSAQNFLGEKRQYIEGNGTIHIVLNEYNITDNHGTYIIEQPEIEDAANLNLSCATSVYRIAAPGADEPLEYAFSQPVAPALSGVSAGIYNSINPEGGDQPVYNWLSIYNPGEMPLEGSILVYDQAGSSIDQIRFADIAPGAREDFALGHTQGQIVGMYRIVLFDDRQPYGAFLTRYSQSALGKFNYAFPLSAKKGSCDSGPVPASTMDPATNWGEIANPTSIQDLEAIVEIRNQLGELIHQEIRSIGRFSQQHIYLNQYLGPRNIGTFRVRCLDQEDENKSLLVQSLFYGHQATDLSVVEWAYATPAPEEFSPPGDALTALVNTHFGAANWFKISELADFNSALQESIYDFDGVLSNKLASYVAKGGTRDLALHQRAGPDYIGSATVSSLTENSLLGAELLRVFPKQDGSIGYIMNLAATRIPNAITANRQVIQAGIESRTEITLTASNEETNELSFWISERPKHGRLRGTPPNISYEPDDRYRGADEFEFRVSDGTNSSRPGKVRIDVQGWNPPIGIPEPEFGFDQVAPSSPSPWNSGIAGFYYVDTFAAGATDLNNPYGFPGQPRQSVPAVIPPGSVVEIHGAYSFGAFYSLTSSGTSDAPIFIRGAAEDNKPVISHPWHISGSYLILENLKFADRDGERESGEVAEVLFLGPAHHVALRYSEVSGNNQEGGIHVLGWLGQNVNNILIYNNVIEENGERGRWSENSIIHNIEIGPDANNIWIAANEISSSGGYGVLVDAEQLPAAASTNHIYIGANRIHSNRLGGVWLRHAEDIIVSENEILYHRPTEDTIGAQAGYEYGPSRLWFMANKLAYGEVGFASLNSVAASGNGRGEDIYFLNNLVIDLSDSQSFQDDAVVDAVAFRLSDSGPSKYIFNNTIDQVKEGISMPFAQSSVIAANNILSDVEGRSIYIETPFTAQNSVIHDNLFDPSALISWAGSNFSSPEAFAAAVPGQCAGCFGATPNYTDNWPYYFDLERSSPAIDSGNGLTLQLANDRFFALYQLAIDLDYTSRVRIIGAEVDLGALEFRD